MGFCDNCSVRFSFNFSSTYRKRKLPSGTRIKKKKKIGFNLSYALSKMKKSIHLATENRLTLTPM